MAENIKPALTPQEWADMPDSIEWQAARLGDKARIIALANAALPDGDARKFTHLDVEALRETARVQERALAAAMGPGTDNYIERLRRLAAALESYLPPEE